MITLNATHQQTKRVVDPVMGTYQTVLTIDPSVSQSDTVGTYSCTVENARGESSRIVVISGNGELIPCACTIGYAVYHSLVKQHPSLKKCPTPTIFMHFLLCYVHYMYLPTDYQHLVILSPHPRKSAQPQCLVKFYSNERPPWNELHTTDRVHSLSFEKYSIKRYAYLKFVLYFTKGYYVVAFHRLTSKSNMHLLMVTCCRSKCRVLSKLGFKAAGRSN